MSRTLLITRPEHDPPTRYISRWAEKVIEEANVKNIAVIDLHKEKAGRGRVMGTLEKSSPELVMFNGHGNEQAVMGHDNEVLLREDDQAVAKSKVIYARACASAKQLGPAAVVHGVGAYIGYDEEFAFTVNAEKVGKPLEDETAALFLKPSNYVAIALLKGHSAAQAHERSKNLFRKNIEKLLSQGPTAEDYDVISTLYWDMIHQVCLGDGVVRI